MTEGKAVTVAEGAVEASKAGKKAKGKDSGAGAEETPERQEKFKAYGVQARWLDSAHGAASQRCPAYSSVSSAASGSSASGFAVASDDSAGTTCTSSFEARQLFVSSRSCTWRRSSAQASR